MAQLEVERAQSQLRRAGIWNLPSTGNEDSSSFDNFFTFRQSFGQPAVALAQRKYNRMGVALQEVKLQQRSQEVAARVFECWQRWAWQSARVAAAAAAALCGFSRIAEALRSRSNHPAGTTIAAISTTNAAPACRCSGSRKALRQLQLETRSEALPTDSLPLVQPIALPETAASLPPAMQLQQQLSRQAQQAWKVEQWKFSPSLSAGYFVQELENVGGFQGWQLTVGIPLWFRPRAAQAQSARLGSQAQALATDYALSRHEMQLVAAGRWRSSNTSG